MDSLSTPVVSAAKLSILNPNEFDLWKMRIEQYFLMTNYSLWEVILNGDSPVPIIVVDGVVQPVAHRSAEQKLARRNELKARGTLLMALPDKHQLKFNSHKDSKTLMEAIEKRFGGNTKMKKVQKTLLKQQFKNFAGSSSENLDHIHDRLLPSEWKTYTLIWRNKADLKEHSLDDLFNSLKIYEAKIDVDDLKEMDLRWQMAMLTMRAKRKGHFARECRSPKDSRRSGATEPQRRTAPVKNSTSNALVSQCDGTFMPPKPDLVFHTAPIDVETDHSAFTVQLSPSKPTQDFSHTNRPSAPIIEDWISYSKDESETNDPQSVSSFVQYSEQVKTPRHSVQPVEAPILDDTLKSTSPKSNSSSKRRNRKTCFVCRSVDHLKKDCDYQAKKKAQPTPRNYAHGSNNKQNALFTHKHPPTHMVPAAVLTQSKPVSITAVRLV
nr:ribonuclease H-like domain-containing protein [Tanacetum cinerariifolium]